ncbi:hypothetical protein ZTR_08487 [Talaromyces verruculosus]|nr:hypothetical protein ZTR_08487 [Talaromyces verruculosus]
MSYAGGALAWRLPISMQILPCFIIAILVKGLPESPRWLVQKGRIQEAVQILAHVFNAEENDETVQSERNAMIDAVALERSNPFRWTNVFHPNSVRTGYRIFLACLVLFMNQASFDSIQWAGINVIVFYAPTVLETNVGLPHSTALITSGFLNLAFTVGSLIPAFKLDTWGRKKPMMGGAFGAAISMMIVAILLSFRGTPHEKTLANVLIAFFVTFMLCFGASLNAIPWCYSAEILPLHVRAQGTSIAVMVNWICVFIIVMTTPIMVANIAWKTYLVFMVMNFIFVPIIYIVFPETAGLSLEQIDYIFVKRGDSEVVEAVGSSPALSQIAEKETVNGGKYPGTDEAPESKHIEK